MAILLCRMPYLIPMKQIECSSSTGFLFPSSHLHRTLDSMCSFKSGFHSYYFYCLVRKVGPELWPHFIDEDTEIRQAVQLVRGWSGTSTQASWHLILKAYPLHENILSHTQLQKKKSWGRDELFWVNLFSRIPGKILKSSPDWWLLILAIRADIFQKFLQLFFF